MPGVFGILGGDPASRPARRERMAVAMARPGQPMERADWPGAAVGVITRASDRATPMAAAGPWRVGLEGRAEGLGDAAAIAALLDARGPADLGGLDGWHTGIATDGAHVWLFTGFLAVEPLFVAVRPGEVVFAPEVKGVVAALDGAPGLDVGACFDALRFGHALGTDTLAEGVTTLAPGTRLRVSLADATVLAEPIPSRPAPPCAPADVGEWLLARWPRLVARCLDRPGRVAGLLTGGLDSRVVMIPAPPDVPAYTFGRDGTTDIVLARALAAGMGRPFYRLDVPDDALARVGDDVLDRLDGLLNPMHAPGAATNAEVAESADHLASGAFGDVLFGSRWRAVPDDADGVTCLAATLEVPPRVEGLLVDAPPARDRLARHAGPGEGWREVTRATFAHRVRRFTAAAIAERRHTTETVHPFYARELFAAVDLLPVEERRDGAFYQRFVRDLAPALAHVPWSRTGAPILAPPDAIAQLAAARRRERSWDRLLRTLRLGGRWDPQRYIDTGWLLRNDRATREWARSRLADLPLPFLRQTAVDALLDEHLRGKRDHATLIGRVIAVAAWARR